MVLTTMFVVPCTVSAAGGYCVIKGEKVYHSAFCSDTWGYNIEDMKWYKTQSEADRTGCKPCEYCIDAMVDYEEDGSTRWHSKDEKIQNALEMERFMGVMDSMDIIEEERDAAYEEGFDIGNTVGYDEGYQAGFDEGKSSKKRSNAFELFLLIIPCVMAFFFGKHQQQTKSESELKKYRLENAKMSATLRSHEKAMSVLDFLSEKTNLSAEHLATTLYINYRKAGGATEADAKAELYDNELRKNN